MKTSIFTFILLSAFIIASCNSTEEETNAANEDSTEVGETENDSEDLKRMKERQDHAKSTDSPVQPTKDESPTSETNIEPLDVHDKITNLDLLQGKWQHTEDESAQGDGE